MKKRFLNLAVLFSFILLLPFTVKAEVINLDNYEQKNLVETLEAEEMEIQASNYKESKDQVTIYMFRGDGCGFCRNFLTYLNSISEEYGYMFKLRSFEVWKDTTNSDLLKKMSDVTGQSASGVPFIIIGEKVFKGYIADWDEDILEAIKTEYAKKDKFDYFKEYNEKQKQTIGGSNTTLIIVVIVADVVTIIAFYVISERNKKEVMRHMTKIYRRLQNIDDTVIEENNGESDTEEIAKEEEVEETVEAEEDDLEDKKSEEDEDYAVKKEKKTSKKKNK